MQLGQNRRDYRPRGLARAVGVERACHRDGQVERVVQRQRHHVTADLGRRVGRLRLERMLLGYRHEARRAVRLTRGGMHEARDFGAPARVGDIERSLHVGLDVALGRDVAVRNSNERREVEDNVAPVDGLAARDQRRARPQA